MAYSTRATGSLAFLLLLLLLTPARERATVAGQVIFPAVESCTLETGEVGRCQLLTDCPPLLQTFRQRPPVTCGFRGSIPIVCCPSIKGNNTDLLQHSLDISPPPGNGTLNCGKSAIKTSGRLSSSSLLSLARPKRASIPQLLKLRSFLVGTNRPAVVGGEISVRDAWPWVALLGQSDTEGINWFCDGVLINEYWVLSAAHCFHNHKTDVVRLGEHDYANDNDGAFPEDFDVIDLVVYPDYKPMEAYHDLALLKLGRKVKLQTFILPVCLPWGDKSDENIIGTVTTVVGWGYTLFGGLPSSVLMEADVQVFPSSRCDRSYSSLPEYQAKWPQGIGEETLCAGDPEGGKDACQGDSGGPLVSKDARGRFVLAGIVSRGYGCGHKDYPGLYANLRHRPYLAWVKKVAFGTQ